MRIASAIWTFLTTERSLGGSRGRARATTQRRAKRRKQRGVALVAVMIAIAMTLVISNQFSTNTNIDLIAAANYQDQMRAHFLARSAANLSELVIRLQQRIDNIQQLRGMVQITDFADQVLLAFCGSPEEVQAAVGFNPSDAKGLGADIGTCGILGSIGTEDDKINLNCANSTATAAENLKTMLTALMYFPAYDPVFEEPDAEGWRRDRTTQVLAILDYIDSDSMRGRDRGTTEDYGYESLKDDYKAKNNYIDTVGEAKLIRGIDDRFWALFGSAFTVYGGCTINLSALSNSQLIAGILLLTAKDPNDPVLQNPQKLFTLAGLVAKAKQFGMSFTSTSEFVEFVRDPQAQLNLLAAGGGLAGSAASSALSQGFLPGEKVGLVLDQTKVDQIATAGPRRTYRVQAWGEIERKQKNADGTPVFPPIRATVHGVWDMKVVPQNVRKPPAPNGAWVFLRED
jgi:hypothetical protein